MRHLLRTNSSLVPLIDRLNRYSIGLVDNAKLREILNLLFRRARGHRRLPLPVDGGQARGTLRGDGHSRRRALRRPRAHGQLRTPVAGQSAEPAKPPDGYAEIDSSVCLGCAVCASACERGAISAMKRRGYRRLPRSPVGLFARMLWGKGRLTRQARGNLQLQNLQLHKRPCGARRWEPSESALSEEEALSWAGLTSSRPSQRSNACRCSTRCCGLVTGNGRKTLEAAAAIGDDGGRRNTLQGE